ncbi:MAG: DUF116 domain-containing protein [Actinomycetota bacterium]|nr:DUF116 domain-containing protein [Actinomycetota bacterium]
MNKWRVLDTGIRTAAENMALDAAILEAKAKELIPNTLRFLRFSPPAVLVGYHQSIEREVRVDFCRQNGIDINRRITGGGAIFFDRSQLGWELIGSKESLNFSVASETFFRKVCSAVICALRKLGLNASFRPKNDIEIDGRKISGTGGTEEGGAFLFQGTLLMDFDVEMMLKTLKIPVEKLKEKEIESVKDRVTWLKRELGYLPSLGEVKRSIREGFEEVFQVEFFEGDLTAEERNLFGGRMDEFCSDEWIHKVRYPIHERQILKSTRRVKGGLIRVTLAVNTRPRRIQSALITGDFFAFPRRTIFDLEATLKDIEASEECVREKVLHFFENEGHKVLDVSPEDFIEAITEALSKIEYPRYGISLSEANRIFTVNGTLEEILKKNIPILLLPYCAKLKGCKFRYEKDCTECGKCSVGEAYGIARGKEIVPTTIVNFEDLMDTLEMCKTQGIEAFMGSCCEAFYAKHREDFERAGLPGILINIDNNTCYGLGKEQQAYAGTFENQTQLRLDLLRKIFSNISPPARM